MVSSISARYLIAFPVLLLAVACSGQTQDKGSPANTASATPAASTDSAAPAPPADTTAAAATSTDTSAATMPQTPPPPKRIKPSIDPGRKAASTTPPSAARGATPAATATPPASEAPAAAQGQGLKYDASSNTVTFDLIGGPNGFQFNGYSSGGATLTLPPKANVVINFVNKDGTPHSAEVVSGEGPLPNASTDPAIPRAYTNQALQGLPQEGSDVMKFQVPDKGTYRIFCGVPGHGLSGMWIWMKVDPAAKAPTFGPTKQS